MAGTAGILPLAAKLTHFYGFGGHTQRTKLSQDERGSHQMIIGYVFVGAITGVLAAGCGIILLDFSVFWAAVTYSIVGSLGFLVAAGICVLRANNSLETSALSSEKSSGMVPHV